MLHVNQTVSIYINLFHNYSDSKNCAISEEGSRDQRHYRAVTCTGRQPNSDVFVFSPTLHLDKWDNIIPADEQQYLWIPQILDKLNQVTNPLASTPSIHAAAMHDVVRGIKHLSGENVYSGILLLGL